MNSHFLNGFADELIKTAQAGGMPSMTFQPSEVEPIITKKTRMAQQATKPSSTGAYAKYSPQDRKLLERRDQLFAQRQKTRKLLERRDQLFAQRQKTRDDNLLARRDQIFSLRRRADQGSEVPNNLVATK